MTATIIRPDFGQPYEPGTRTYNPDPGEHDAVNEPPYPRSSLLGIMISCAAFWATVAWVLW